MHLSSSPNYEGPRLGQPLNDELKRALAVAEAVILVFTSDTEDWSYCMWECGIATNPSEARPTSVVVVQCTPNKPKPFGDQLRVDARDLDSVQAFVKALLTTTDFFPRRDAPMTGFAPEGSEVTEFAVDLHAKLAGVLPSGGGAERSTPTAPYLRLRLDDHAAEELRTAYLEGATDQCLPILEARAEIAESIGADRCSACGWSPERRSATCSSVASRPPGGMATPVVLGPGRTGRGRDRRHAPPGQMGAIRDHDGSGGCAVCRGRTECRDRCRARRVHRALRARGRFPSPTR